MPHMIKTLLLWWPHPIPRKHNVARRPWQGAKPWLCAGLLLWSGGLALAQEQEPAPRPEPASPEAVEAPAPQDKPATFDYQVGMAMVWGSSYSGGAASGIKLRPVWGIQYGRFRLATSRASLIERSSGQSALPGASMELGTINRWRFDAALRVDAGRKSKDAPELQGLPDVDPTLRLRLLAEYKLDDDARVGLNLNTDLANKKGGSLLSLDYGQGGTLAPQWRWGAGVGLQAADATYMTSYHGVPPGTTSTFAVYQPSAGLHSVRAGVGLTWRFAPHWRAGAAAGASYLLGPAASSPLTQQRLGTQVTVGLVYIGKP
ncbi:MAG: hypothetical protein C4K60_15985 [Ideonella sp. MAG2]|nr:MAG: hypothetical protein C4K60_15985 [Ideonella sp. MAG2]